MLENVVISFKEGSSDPRVISLELPEVTNGEYLLTVTDGVVTLVENPLPILPTVDGNYQLTVVSGVLSWTAIL